MKKLAKSISGVTLLEIMLVLAVAAMIIIMSVRYYQSATANQQANTVLQIIQGITGNADTLATSSNTYANITTASVGALMPGGATTGMQTPWGGTVTITGGTANSYQVSFSAMPSTVCPIVLSRLQANTHFSGLSACSASAATFGYTYTSSM